jgi:RNA polymerase-binding transcription factor DksA
MRSRQIAERLGVEEAHMLEFQQFNMIWDRKMADYERHAEELIEAMKERHAAELRDYQRQLMGKQTRPKFSKDLLNLRKIQDTLAKQKEWVYHICQVCVAIYAAMTLTENVWTTKWQPLFFPSYAEAHKIKLKADALEAWELEKWHSQRQQDLLMKEGKFKHSKQQELVALQKRVQTGREEQKKQRHQDLERLLQRYQNVKAELEAQQNLERVRMEKLVQSGNLMGSRRWISR